MRVAIYTDGSSGKDGHGGAAAILVGRRYVLEVGAHIGPPTTNQRAEMLGVIIGLSALTETGVQVRVVSDSAYVVNCWKQAWIRAWRRRGWRTSDKKPVRNRELWETMESLVALHHVEFEHVRGHSGDHYNERADVIAHNARIRRASGRRRVLK